MLISGASGLIATELIEQLRALGHTPVRLVRRPASAADEVEWHPERGFIAPGALTGIDAVVNLAGATIGRMPWTPGYRKLIVSSRIDSTRTLVEAINAADVKPRVLISASGSSYYGNTGDVVANEGDAKGSGFLCDLTAAWEAEAAKVNPAVRVAMLRTPLVLSRRQGALGRLLPLVKLGLAGPLGSGSQWWGWISLPDQARAIIHLINQSDARGPFNLAAPQTATCRELMQALARAFGRPAWLRVPTFALHLAFGQAADELLLVNQKLGAAKLAASGFEYQHPTLESAMRWVAGK